MTERRQYLDKKQYLGDGVYVALNNCGQMVLTAENGIEATDTIYFESDVLNAFLRYVEVLKAELHK